MCEVSGTLRNKARTRNRLVRECEEDCPTLEPSDEYCRKCGLEKWVLLEDAQKEIDKLRDQNERAIRMNEKNLGDYLLLKKTFDLVREAFKNFPDPKELPSMFRHKAWNWKKEIEGLLKETKQ